MFKVVDGKVWYKNKLIHQFNDSVIIREKSFAMNLICQMDQDIHADIRFEAIDAHLIGEAHLLIVSLVFFNKRALIN